jgi:hypothetical protein
MADWWVTHSLTHSLTHPYMLKLSQPWGISNYLIIILCIRALYTDQGQGTYCM